MCGAGSMSTSWRYTLTKRGRCFGPSVVPETERSPRASRVVTVTAHDAQGELSVSGTTLGPKHRPRLVKVYRQDVDIEPAQHMAFLRYADVPGMIGKIGTKVGEFGINIGQMGVGREVRDQTAVMGLTLDEPLTAEQLDELVTSCGLMDGKRVEL